MTSVQNNDQRLLDRILEDQHRKLAPDKSRDDFFTFFAADKALQDWDLDNDEIMDGIVDGAHDCGIDGIWTFVDERYVTADAHQFLPSRRRQDRIGDTASQDLDGLPGDRCREAALPSADAAGHEPGRR